MQFTDPFAAFFSRHSFINQDLVIFICQREDWKLDLIGPEGTKIQIVKSYLRLSIP